MTLRPWSLYSFRPDKSLNFGKKMIIFALQPTGDVVQFTWWRFWVHYRKVNAALMRRPGDAKLETG
jgi:hypothetical protein